jgi:hypothetical protein
MPPIVPTIIYLFPQNTQVLSIEGLIDEISGGYLNSASVSATLLDQNYNPDSILNNISMSYVAASNGNYEGVVPASFNPTLGSGYTLQYTVNQDGVQAVISVPCQVKLRAK